MADAVGWRSFWWLNVALHLFTFLVLLVALPETKWDRRSASSELEKGSPAFDSQEEKQTPEASPDRLEEPPSSARPNESKSQPNQVSQDTSLGKGKPSRHQWQVFQTSPRPFWTLIEAFYLPWKLFTFPIVVFASFIVGFSGSCYLMITFVQSQAFGAPPYNFSPQSVGFMNFASLVGALIGLLTAGSLSDRVSAKLTERNRGIREPEMRLVAMVPYVIIMLLGNFVMAFGLQSGWDWRVKTRVSALIRPFPFRTKCMLTAEAGYRDYRFRMCRHPGSCTPCNRIYLCCRFVQASSWLDICRRHCEQEHLGIWCVKIHKRLG